MVDAVWSKTNILKVSIIPIIYLVGISFWLCHIYNITPNEKIYDFNVTALSNFVNWASATVAYLALIYTAVAIRASSSSARKQATIDLVMDLNADKRLQTEKNNIYSKKDELTKYYCNLPPDENGEKDDIHYVLNRYEFIALGIRFKSLDEELYKNLQYSNMQKLWEITSPLIAVIRQTEGKNTIYQELEWLFHRWGKSPIKSVNN